MMSSTHDKLRSSYKLTLFTTSASNEMNGKILHEHLFPTKVLADVSGSSIADIAFRRKTGLFQCGELRARSMYYSAVEVFWGTLLQELIRSGTPANTASVAAQVASEEMVKISERSINEIYVVIKAGAGSPEEAVHIVRRSSELGVFFSKQKQFATVIPLIEKSTEILGKLSEYASNEWDGLA